MLHHKIHTKEGANKCLVFMHGAGAAHGYGINKLNLLVRNLIFC